MQMLSTGIYFLKIRFKNINLSKQWLDVENERFIVWMRNAPFPDFRKLWGIIDQDLPKGTYKLSVTTNWDISKFDGEKSIVLSQTNFLGGKNYFLAYCYLVVGGISLILAISFILLFFG